MRTLAQRLGSGTATLYRHFDNRAALVAKLVDHVLGEAVRDAGDLSRMRWEAACRTHAHAVFEALCRHRKLAPLLADHVPVGANAMALREAAIAALLDDGFSSRLAARSFVTVARYVLGFVIQASSDVGARGVDPAHASAFFRGLDRSRYPATISVAELLPEPIEEEFSFGLDLIIVGLKQARRKERKASASGGR